MRYIIIAAFVAAAAAGPALADTTSVALGAHNDYSSFTFAGFNGALGTLQSVQFTLQGNANFAVKLGQPTTGPVNYTAKTTLFLYTNNPNTYPAISLTGAGTATPDPGGNFTLTTSGTGTDAAITTQSLLTQFTTTTPISASFSVDLPTQLSVTSGGNPVSVSNVAFSSGISSGTVIYTYLAPGGAVPEPASWALMMAGFGMVGGALRRGRTGAAPAA